MDSERQSVHIELPPRVLPVPLRQLARAANGVGLTLVVVGSAPLLWGKVHGPVWLHLLCAICALIPLALGFFLLYGRSSIDCVGKQLLVREQAGPLSYRRRFAVGSITHLQVEELTFNLGGRDERGRNLTESITVLAASTKDEGRRVLLFGYPPGLLEHVVAELRRRSSWAAPVVAGLGRS